MVLVLILGDEREEEDAEIPVGVAIGLEDLRKLDESRRIERGRGERCCLEGEGEKRDSAGIGGDVADLGRRNVEFRPSDPPVMAAVDAMVESGERKADDAGELGTTRLDAEPFLAPCQANEDEDEEDGRRLSRGPKSPPPLPLLEGREKDPCEGEPPRRIELLRARPGTEGRTLVPAPPPLLDPPPKTESRIRAPIVPLLELDRIGKREGRFEGDFDPLVADVPVEIAAKEEEDRTEPKEEVGAFSRSVVLVGETDLGLEKGKRFAVAFEGSGES